MKLILATLICLANVACGSSASPGGVDYSGTWGGLETGTENGATIHRVVSAVLNADGSGSITASNPSLNVGTLSNTNGEMIFSSQDGCVGSFNTTLTENGRNLTFNIVASNSACGAWDVTFSVNH